MDKNSDRSLVWSLGSGHNSRCLPNSFDRIYDNNGIEMEAQGNNSCKPTGDDCPE